MDLSTVSEKLQSGVYETTQQFHADIMKIINNSYLFNGVNEDFLRITSDFEKYYYRISGETKPADKVNPKAPQVLPSKSQKKRKRNQPNSRDNNELQPITTEDKKELAAMIHRLAKEHMKGIRSIVFEGASDQVEVDLELLPQKKLRELLKYVRGRIYEMESSIRSTLQEKCEGRELDEQYSDKTDSFIDESYWECK